MKKQKLITILKEENILDNIENGPTSMILSDGKKDHFLQIKQVDDHIAVTAGKILKRRIRIPIRDIKK